MDQPSKWAYYLHLVEFAYNNGYHSSLNMSPFKAMYGRKCNTRISWDSPTDRVIGEPELLKDREDQMVKIKQNLKVAQDRQKSYADQNSTAKLFQVGNHVFLKVRPRKSSLNLGICSNLVVRHC